MFDDTKFDSEVYDETTNSGSSILGSIKEGDTTGLQKARDDIRLMQDLVETWRETSGMHALLDELKQEKRKQMDVNDVTLTLAHGIENGTQQAVAGVGESAIISALLMSFSVPAFISPPDAISELDGGDWRKILHLYSWGIMSAVGATVIIYARVYSAAVSRAVRSAEKLRIHLRGNPFNDTLMLLYNMFFWFSLGVLSDTSVYYGTANGIVMTFISAIICWLGAFRAKRFILAGHIEYGWRRHRDSRDDPVDDYLMFETLHKKMVYAKELKKGAKSIFEWDDNEKNATARGLSKNGQELFKDFNIV